MQKKEKSAQKSSAKQMDFVLLVIIILLLALGIIMVLSASAPSALATYGNSYHNLLTQLEAAGIGLIAMIFFINFDYILYAFFYRFA